MEFTTANGHRYYHNPHEKQTLYLHPNMLTTHSNELRDDNNWNSQYYHLKYNWLKSHGYFKSTHRDGFLKKELTGENIASFLFTTKHISFEVTESCNLACKYCGYGELYNDHALRGKNFMKFDLVKVFVNYFLKESVPRPKLNISFYGGEPLLNFPLIEKIVALLTNHTKKPERLTFSMTTNGTLLSRHIDFFIKHNFRISISLDGNSENNEYRIFGNGGVNSFDEVYSNVCMVKNKYPEYFHNNISFFSVLHSKNSVSSIANFFEHEFGKSSRIANLSTVDVNEGKVADFNRMYRNYFESIEDSGCEMVVKAKASNNLNMLSSFIRDNSGLVYHKYLDLLYEYKESKLPTATCLPFTKKIFITADGNILPCERIGLQHSFGKVTEQGVDIDFSKIAKTFNDYYSKVRAQCIKCAKVYSCNRCMLYMEINKQQHFICDGFYTNKQQENYLANVFGIIESNPEWIGEILEERIYE